MSRCSIKLSVKNPEEVRQIHWTNLLVNGYCQNCGLGMEKTEGRIQREVVSGDARPSLNP